MKTLKTLCVFLALVLSSCASEKRSIRVITEDGDPVSGAVIIPKPVLMFDDNAHITNDDGWARIHDPRGEYKLQILAEGYQRMLIDYPDEDGVEIVLKRE